MISSACRHRERPRFDVPPCSEAPKGTLRHRRYVHDENAPGRDAHLPAGALPSCGFAIRSSRISTVVPRPDPALCTVISPKCIPTSRLTVN